MQCRHFIIGTDLQVVPPRSLVTYRACRACGEVVISLSSSSFKRCPECGRLQNWLGTARQPSWWPQWIPVVDTRMRQWRWTYWVVTLATVTTIVVGSVMVSGGGSNMNSSSGPVEIPNVVGMNLQEAQDCLQSYGFWNLDDQPEPGEPRFQVNDSNWTVTSQTPTGTASSSDARVTLHSRRDGGGSSKSCP